MGMNKPITIVASMQRVVTFVRRCRSGDAVTNHMFSEALRLQLSPDIDFPDPEIYNLFSRFWVYSPNWLLSIHWSRGSNPSSGCLRSSLCF